MNNISPSLYIPHLPMWLISISFSHSCDNGKLAPPEASTNGTFKVAVVFSATEIVDLQANGLVFRVGGSPSTYCPSNIAACPASVSETVWTCADGLCDLVCRLRFFPFGVLSSFQSLLISSTERRSARWPANLHRPQRRRLLHPSTLRLRSPRFVVQWILGGPGRILVLRRRRFLRLPPSRWDVRVPALRRRP